MAVTEFVPWYQPSEHLHRCLTCGSLISSGDFESHIAWHKRLDPFLEFLETARP